MVRPGYENLKLYKKYKNELLRNIGMFKYMKFLIRQFNERKTCIDKLAIEYHWGQQKFSKQEVKKFQF